MEHKDMPLSSIINNSFAVNNGLDDVDQSIASAAPLENGESFIHVKDYTVSDENPKQNKGTPLKTRLSKLKKSEFKRAKKNKTSQSTFYLDSAVDGLERNIFNDCDEQNVSRSTSYPPCRNESHHLDSLKTNIPITNGDNSQTDIISNDNLLSQGNCSALNIETQEPTGDEKGRVIAEKFNLNSIVGPVYEPNIACELENQTLASIQKRHVDNSVIETESLSEEFEHIRIPENVSGELTSTECSDVSSVINDVTAESGLHINGVDVYRSKTQVNGTCTDDNVTVNVGDDVEDADRGVYAESHRHSKWLFVGDNELSCPSDDASSSCADSEMDEDAFADETGEESDIKMSPLLSSKGHRRVDSFSSTTSESEFRKFNAVSRRVVQRKNSTQEYQRTSERFCEAERPVVLERPKDGSYGFHVNGEKPTYISTVEEGSVAENKGVQIGDILVSVNGIKVLDAHRGKIIQLLKTDNQRIMMELSKAGSLTSYTQSYDDHVSMKGYLTKQCGTGLLKTWRKRWCVLKSDDCMYYYKTPEDQEPLGAIMLKNYVITKVSDLSKKHSFKASKFGAKTYYFIASSEDTMIRWASAMNAAAYGKEKVDFLNVTSQNVDIPALSIKHPDCHGYLCKLIARSLWRRRYCVLKDAVMYYYQDLTSVTALGVAHLHGYIVGENMTPTRKFSFSLSPPERSMKTFNFSAENETDFKRWTTALTKSINRWIKAK